MESVEQVAQEFDLRTRYQWDKDASITISGMDFSILYTTIKGIAQSRTTSDITIDTIMNVGSSLNLLTQKLIEMVESGIATTPLQEKS